MGKYTAKKATLLLIFFLFIQIFSSFSHADAQKIEIFFNGICIDTGDVEPFIENGRTLVPFRAIFEAFGAEIAWDGNTKTVSGITEESELWLTIDNTDAIVNGLEIELDVPARIENSRTFVPLRFVAEGLGAEVEWNASTNTVSIEAVEYEMKLVKGIGTVVFADKEQGKQILTRNDDYMRFLSDFDRSSKMRINSEANIEEFKQYFGEQVMAFSQEEKNMIAGIIEEIRPLIGQYDMYFPQEIVFIKTTGREEGHAAYTRSNAIIFPQAMIDSGEEFIRDIVIHEFFHVFSRFNSEKREQLYSVIDFKKGPFFEYPEEMTNMRLSNPDAVYNRYYIEMNHEGEYIIAVPVLYASEKFNTAKSTNFFDYLYMKLAIVEIRNGRCIPVYKDGKPLLIDPTKSFYDRVGRNSDYIIQPEELLAENFVMMINKDDVPSPFVIEGMKEKLSH